MTRDEENSMNEFFAKADAEPMATLEMLNDELDNGMEREDEIADCLKYASKCDDLLIELERLELSVPKCSDELIASHDKVRRDNPVKNA